MSKERQLQSKMCVGHQVNRRVPDFFCTKGGGHAGGHTDPATGKVWGTPTRPYGVRGSKASARRKVRGG